MGAALRVHRFIDQGERPMASEEFAGPIDYIVFALDEGADLSAGLAAILERVDQGIVEILDIELIARDVDGHPMRRHLESTDFDGAESDILDDEDLAGIADALGEGQVALAIVYEDRSLASAAAAFRALGGMELFSGGIAVDDLERNLDRATAATA
ncbi:MAG: hypothetical protein J0I43_07590 [Microbacterium sp.]|uniref:hypothetical protein n=1 Tax=Microbacterium sp. TaxID=51671 RepID=UPI001ACC7AEA|nr:hypothetical protein [Microbacterium sp.]MBN9177210.1 hypothetical protein [Microbacterium sp.]